VQETSEVWASHHITIFYTALICCRPCFIATTGTKGKLTSIRPYGMEFTLAAGSGSKYSLALRHCCLNATAGSGSRLNCF